jgi:dTDP-4-dehydrorhamnose 3,5-epimerase
MINGVILTPLSIIEHPKGNILHAMKASAKGYSTFGEAYFSEVNRGEIKGWKKHREMLLNLIVPVGCIAFSMLDDRSESPTYGQFYKVELSQKNYCRLTVPPGIWMSFKGISEGTNLLLNIASIEHTDADSENLPLSHEKFCSYDWE